MGELIEVEGDLLDGTWPVIGHGVNLLGVMGGGVAAQIARRWPDVKARYVEACNEEIHELGDVLAVTNAGETLAVFNLFTQRFPGADARLPALAQAIYTTLAGCEYAGYPGIAVPRIGCGIGGLNWVDVRRVLEVAASESKVNITVVTPPESEPAA